MKGGVTLWETTKSQFDWSQTANECLPCTLDRLAET